MENLREQQCEACRADAPRVEESEAATLLAQLPDWQQLTVDGVPRLKRSYRFKNFAQALAFTDRVGAMAEAMGHHPDILTRWGEVELSWWTHKIKGLHRNDFICAARSDALYQP